MNFLEYYYHKIIKLDLINRFNYKNINKIPELKQIILNFGCKASESLMLSTSLLSLQLITTKKGNLTVSKTPNMSLRIRKGNPVGCKVVLTRKIMYKFYTKLLIDIFPRLTKKVIVKKTFYENSLTYNIESILVFRELEKSYTVFNSLRNLHITFVTSTETKEELLFLLNSFKFLVKTT